MGSKAEPNLMSDFSDIISGQIGTLSIRPPITPLKSGHWTLEIHSVFIDNVKPIINPEDHVLSTVCQFKISSNFVTQFETKNSETVLRQTPLHILGTTVEKAGYFFVLPQNSKTLINSDASFLSFDIDWISSENPRLKSPIYDSAIFHIHYSLKRISID